MSYKFNLKKESINKVFKFMSTELDYFKECAAIRRYTKGIFLVGAVFFVVEFIFLINNIAMSASGDLFNIRVIMEYIPNFWM